MAAPLVTLVNGAGVKVKVAEGKVDKLRAVGFRKQGGRPPAVKPSETSE